MNADTSISALAPDEEIPRPERERWLRLLFVAAVFIHVAMFASLFFGYLDPWFDNASRMPQGTDFFAIYQGGTRALHGESIYNLAAAASVPYSTPYRYLPFFAYSGGAAFNALPPGTGYWLWVDLIELFVVANAWLTFRVTRDRMWRWVAASLWFAFTPLYLEVYMGQWSLLMATLMLWTAVALERRWRQASGIWWGVSVLIKSNTALLGPIFVRLRQWRVLVGAGAAVVVLNAPYFLIHPGDGRWFWDLNFGRLSQGQGSFLDSGDLSGVEFLRAAWIAVLPGSIDFPVAIERVFVAVVVGLSLAATALPRRTDAIALFAMWSSSFFLVYPSWEHHYVMLLPALALLLALRPRYRWLALGVFLLTAVPTPYALIEYYAGGPAPEDVPFNYSAEWNWPAWASLLYHAIKPVPVAGLWSVLVFGLIAEGLRERSSRRRPEDAIATPEPAATATFTVNRNVALRSVLIAPLAGALLAGAVAIETRAFNPGSAESPISDVRLIADRSVVAGGSATFVRDDEGIDFTLETSGLPVGHIIIVKALIFNSPRACTHPAAGARCGADDIGADGVDGSIVFTKGFFLRQAGAVNVTGRIDTGDDTRALVGSGLTNPRGAEVRLVIVDHGPPLTGLYSDQISTIGGGCTDAPAGGGRPGPNTCAELQFAVNEAAGN